MPRNPRRRVRRSCLGIVAALAFSAAPAGHVVRVDGATAAAGTAP